MKTDFKRIRTAIAYLFNNPVEKMLCSTAEQYKWNFLSFYDPDRRKTSFKKESRALKRAKNIIDARCRENKYLKHATLKLIFNKLNAEDIEILINYIIESYMPLDTEKTCRYYKSHQDMITAINSNAGNEYEITELHYQHPTPTPHTNTSLQHPTPTHR